MHTLSWQCGRDFQAYSYLIKMTSRKFDIHGEIMSSQACPALVLESLYHFQLLLYGNEFITVSKFWTRSRRDQASSVISVTRLASEQRKQSYNGQCHHDISQSVIETWRHVYMWLVRHR